MTPAKLANPPRAIADKRGAGIESSEEIRAAAPRSLVPTPDSVAPLKIGVGAYLNLVGRACGIATWCWRPKDGVVMLVSSWDGFPIPTDFRWEQVLEPEARNRLARALRHCGCGRTDRFSLDVALQPPDGVPSVSVLCHGEIVEWGGDLKPKVVCGLFELQRDGSSQTSVDPGFQDIAQTRFLANMSHEIRTPINGILGVIELALDTAPNAEQQQYLQSVRSSSRRLLQVLDDVLDYSKAVNNRVEFERDPFNPRHLVRDVLDLFAIDASKKGIDLACEIGISVPETVVGDQGRIRQILFNLVGNAIKFTRAGEVVLMMTASRQGDDGFRFIFRVRDTGIGIARSRMTGIFDPFVQADTSTNRQFGGSGLGLAICKSLVEGMGGKINVESVPDRGTTFDVVLTLTAPSAASAAEAPRFESGRGIKVLVSCARRAIAGPLVGVLSRHGHRVVECPDMHATQACLREAGNDSEPFDAWFLDADLAAEQNYSLLRAYAEADSLGLARCILMSNSLRFVADNLICARYGITGHLRQPAIDTDILEVLETVIHRQEAENMTHQIAHLLEQELVQEARSRRNARRLALVADDDPVNLMVLETTLQRAGYSTRTASNGVEALEQFDDGCFDFVLMDVQMPLIDGIAATEAIRIREQRRAWVRAGGTARATPVIGLTADIQSSVRQQALDAGMNEILIKPIDRETLLSSIERVLDAHE